MNCRYCGSENCNYVGTDDGGGDSGWSVCDEYYCEDCDQGFESNCVEYADDEDDILDDAADHSSENTRHGGGWYFDGDSMTIDF